MDSADVRIRLHGNDTKSNRSGVGINYHLKTYLKHSCIPIIHWNYTGILALEFWHWNFQLDICSFSWYFS